MLPESKKEQARRLSELRAELEQVTHEYIHSLVDSHEAREKHADFLMTILDSVADGLLVYDCDQKIILANQAAAKLAGMSLVGSDKDYIRQKMTFYKHQDGEPFEPLEEPFYHALNKKEACEKEGFVKGDTLGVDGMWIRAHAAPVLDKNKNLLGVVSTFGDITSQKLLQHQRDALASVIAHDIKNHLAGEEMILNYLTNLANLDENAIDAISKMKASNKHHLELATSLLEIFRADFVMNTDSSVDLDLPKIIESVLFLNALAATATGVQVKTDIDSQLPRIKGVPTAIRHSLHNILQNAINMSAKGDSILVSVKKCTNGVSISVTDSGAGMSEDQVSKLFNQNTVASKLPVDSRSSGVGLFFSKLLLDAHKAKLTCKSEVGQGTKFTIELPEAN